MAPPRAAANEIALVSQGHRNPGQLLRRFRTENFASASGDGSGSRGARRYVAVAEGARHALLSLRTHARALDLERDPQPFRDVGAQSSDRGQRAIGAAGAEADHAQPQLSTLHGADPSTSRPCTDLEGVRAPTAPSTGLEALQG